MPANNHEQLAHHDVLDRFRHYRGSMCRVELFQLARDLLCTPQWTGSDRRRLHIFPARVPCNYQCPTEFLEVEEMLSKLVYACLPTSTLCDWHREISQIYQKQFVACRTDYPLGNQNPRLSWTLV